MVAINYQQVWGKKNETVILICLELIINHKPAIKLFLKAQNTIHETIVTKTTLNSVQCLELFTEQKRKKFSTIIYSKIILWAYLSHVRRSKVFISTSFINIFLSDWPAPNPSRSSTPSNHNSHSSLHVM